MNSRVELKKEELKTQPDAAGNISEQPATGDIVAAFLLEHELISEKQLRRAKLIRDKLAQPKTLFRTMVDLDHFNIDDFYELLRREDLKVFIGELLVELGDINQKDLDLAIKMQKDEVNKGKKIGDILLDNRVIKEKRLLEVLSMQFGVNYIRPDFDEVDKSLLDKVTPNECEQYGFMPIMRMDETILIASPDPKNPNLHSMIRSLYGKEGVFAICSHHALKSVVYRFRKHITPDIAVGQSNDSEAMRIVDDFLRAAIKRGASDIHIEPGAMSLRVRFRTDSSLWMHSEYSLDKAPGIISRLKILSKANIAERRRHQDGKIEYSDPATGNTVDVRCSFYINVHGEKACLRLLNRRTELLNIEEIGMSPAVIERFKYEALDIPSGVVLVTGPTGSGKTTTLYSCVDYLNNDDTSIITAEEPVEYVIDGITQCSLNPKIDMTFHETLRHMVRQDPDVIVLGEIRDQESAEAAIQSALTGHKVLTTFHTEDTIGGLLRLMNMNIETFLISSTVVSVLAQRLLKRVCPECSEPYRPTPLEMQLSGLHQDDLKNANFRKGAGCENCRYTGYQGRVSIFELLVLDEKVKQSILTKQASYDIRRISIESSGLVTLLEDGLEKASRGLTSVPEVLRMLPRNEKPRLLSEIKHLSRIGDG